MEFWRVLVQESEVLARSERIFRAQGGLREPWGKSWERVRAKNLEEAQRIGYSRRRARWPGVEAVSNR